MFGLWQAKDVQSFTSHSSNMILQLQWIIVIYCIVVGVLFSWILLLDSVNDIPCQAVLMGFPNLEGFGHATGEQHNGKQLPKLL